MTRMPTQRGVRAAVAAAFVSIGFAVVAPAPTRAADPATNPAAAKSAPDNTGRNQRDRDGNTLTAFDQGESEADRTLTQKIRKAVVDDGSLSMDAHNIKIITVDGVVTLRGPVKSQAEKDRVAAKATQVAGQGKVQNHLEVAP